jgi:hypothetical protein
VHQKFTELVISEERRVISNIISVLHRENGGMQTEALFDGVSGEEGPVFSKLVSPEHDPQGVAVQQDARALNQNILVLGYGEHACG